MKEFHKNPRKLSDEQRAQLEENMRLLGDISGIVHDLNTGEIIGGNQRSKVIDIEKANIVITEDYNKPDKQGTVALGYVEWEGQKWNYRAVRWDEKTRERANITANSLGGDWDWEILNSEWDTDLLSDWNVEIPSVHKPHTDEDDAESFNDDGIEGKSQYGVIIMAKDSAEQEKLFNRFNEEGLTVKIVVT